ncbi:MAG: acetate/propionate family kinase [Candidatus Sphingomonas colombiensis]|nr:acetate/propionate family kinase [Sphingomonas sp.]WEK43232.1 MAG: acetate/propionate family kinase [Sphingomonas sp.]
MSDALLSLNAGSSSLKFALFERSGIDGLSCIASGKIEGIGLIPHLIARDQRGAVIEERCWDEAGCAGLSHEAFLGELLDWADGHLGGDRLIAIGHRVVHGGVHYAEPVVVGPAILETLDTLCPLAPQHQPHNLSAIRAAMNVRPGLPQIACFDTAFHHGMPAVATRFALPRALEAEGIRRYGFHGLSYEYITRQIARIEPRLARGRLIVAHLGNGASLCAINAGHSVETTMGFTALDGLVMGTRCGTIDPGVLLYLQQQKGMSATELEDLLYNKSGLLGISGLSSDMRDLLAKATPDADAAIQSFVYRIVREVGALSSVLGGLDGLVFTAGIGENSAEIRRRVACSLSWLGVELDETANSTGNPVISTAASRVIVRVIPTDEERMIAMHADSLVRAFQDNRATGDQ